LEGGGLHWLVRVCVDVRNVAFVGREFGILFRVNDHDWVRPYTPGTGRWLVIGWEAVALALLAWTTIRQFDLTGPGVRVLACTIAAIWVVGAWRILRMGAYVGPGGLRIRGLFRSRTLRWQEIEHVRLHRAVHKVGPWEIESGMTVLIERHDGGPVNTELWAQGVDFHSRPKVFQAVYHELRNRHLAATV
jgi:hypothetical protein